MCALHALLQRRDNLEQYPQALSERAG